MATLAIDFIHAGGTDEIAFVWLLAMEFFVIYRWARGPLPTRELRGKK